MRSSTADVLGDAARALGRVIQHGAFLGQDLLRSLQGTPRPDAGCSCGAHVCMCEIPAPCWMPEPICGVTSEGCPGGEARVRLRIANCSPAPRRIRVQPLGDPAGVTVSPPELNLGPYQRGFVVVSVTIPAAAAKGEERELVLMVRGCRDHVLRWTVRASTSEACSCDTVEIEDCPDLIHHWYDHFYCARGCAEGR